MCDILWRVIEKREFIAMLVYIVEIDYYYTDIIFLSTFGTGATSGQPREGNIQGTII